MRCCREAQGAPIDAFDLEMCMSECVGHEVMKDDGFKKCTLEAHGRIGGDCAIANCAPLMLECAQKKCKLNITGFSS